MKERILTLLNSQIEKEFESAYAYLDIAAFFDSLSLCGFSRWYKIQAREEELHAMKIYDYIFESDEMVELKMIYPLKEKPRSIATALNLALNHEKEVTRAIHAIYKAAQDEEDYVTTNFLEWFIAEQKEEEDTARKMIAEFKMFGGTSEGMFLLDDKLKKRKMSGTGD
ncbi:MAG: ferritin [Treponema sp.]|nr:ferritin [Treponema sp.]